MRTCNDESQNNSAKGSNFKEDDRPLPLYELLLFGLTQSKPYLLMLQHVNQEPRWISGVKKLSTGNNHSI